MGQVFANIIAIQFKNLMDGDRYQNIVSLYDGVRKKCVRSKMILSHKSFVTDHYDKCVNIVYNYAGSSSHIPMQVRVWKFRDV